MRCKGWDFVAADWVASFSQYVDEDPATKPTWNTVLGPDTSADYHWWPDVQQDPTSGEVRLSGQAKCVQNERTAQDATRAAGQSFAANWGAGNNSLPHAIWFGRWLHTYADTFAHQTFSAKWSLRNRAYVLPWPCIRWGHSGVLWSVDNIRKNLGTAENAIRAIYGLIPDHPTNGRPAGDALGPLLQVLRTARGGDCEDELKDFIAESPFTQGRLQPEWNKDRKKNLRKGTYGTHNIREMYLRTLHLRRGFLGLGKQDAYDPLAQP